MIGIGSCIQEQGDRFDMTTCASQRQRRDAKPIYRVGISLCIKFSVKRHDIPEMGRAV